MSVTLQITAGPHSGRKVVVPRGQIILVGRTRWADESLAADTAMADVHFAVDYRTATCKIADRTDRAATLVNGLAVTEVPLHSGDIVEAGQSKFAVQVQGEPMPVEAVSEVSEEPEVNTARALCAALKMSPAALALLADKQRPVAYVDLLIDAELYVDAIRFVGYWLPPPLAVAWGCRCVESVFAGSLRGKDAAAMARASEWAADPAETKRRAAEAIAEDLNYEGPAAFLAAAAFWSGGSLAPPGIADVPPAPGLASQGILAALLMTAPHGNPVMANERLRNFAINGKSVAAALPEG